MRIIRGHDYYDSALAYGRDDDITFVRETRLIGTRSCPLNEWGFMPSLFYIGLSRGGYPMHNNKYTEMVNGYKTEREFSIAVVYFAGKRYTGVVAHNGLDSVESIWSYESLVHFAAQHGLQLNEGTDSGRGYYANKFTPVTLAESFIPREATSKELEWMIQNKIAIALYTDELGPHHRFDGFVPARNESNIPWRCNSADPEHTLRRYGFMKALDAYSALQELSMFVGGIMGGNPPNMVKITDEKTLVAKHGFDKWSFRRMPEAK